MLKAETNLHSQTHQKERQVQNGTEEQKGRRKLSKSRDP